MANLETMRKDLERGLALRLRRLESETEKSGRFGTGVELEAAEKDVKRATERRSRARIAHSLATAEVQEHADALTALGGKPILPEGFAVYLNPEAASVSDFESEAADLEAATADGVDAAGDFTDPDRNGTANLDEDDGEPEDKRQPRKGGRFATRGQQV